MSKKGVIMKRVKLSVEKTCSSLTCLIHFHGRRSWKQQRSRPDVSPANMKADTSGTFNKSQLYFWCFDGDSHQPPKVQICLLVLWALPTEALMLMFLSLLTLFKEGSECMCCQGTFTTAMNDGCRRKERTPLERRWQRREQERRKC